ncbi:MAG TPA: homocysteine S-methyltransferase family protein [Flexilinea sp.]|nr:homocysteine S-methyltransferase family protein [Flexilinea sp.]
MKNKITLLDGAFGTMLQQKGLLTATVPEANNLTHPEIITEIHREYIRSGAEIIYASTFGVNRYKLEGTSYSVSQLVEAAVKNAQMARDAENPQVKIALDCGPIGKMMKPNGDMSFEEAYQIFEEIVSAGEQSGVDLIVFETFTDLAEMKAGILAAKEHTNLPIFASMSFEANGRTFAGVPISAAALTLSGLGVSAVGINCSLGPEQILPLAAELAKWTNLPILIKPNAGLPNPETDQYEITPEEFAEITARFADLGAVFIGGCCGTTPQYISALRDRLSGKRPAARQAVHRTALCSAERTVEIDEVRIVGERINPTGKKRFKTALAEHDIAYILTQALEQTAAGAEILDVNVGLPGLDEAAVMAEVVEAIQSVSNVPLQIDSGDPKTIEAALRIYNGKALVNSVNGEDRNLETLLPIVRKYGAAVIGLTLDENGLPQTAEERVRIAEKIIRKAGEYGIPKEDVIIDCLTLTVSAQQEQAMETLKAVRMVKEHFGVKTVLGVSNISFGLPDRETINTAFLTLALGQGLDLPIINPNVRSMTGAVDAFKVLSGQDKNSERYISIHNQIQSEKPVVPDGGSVSSDSSLEYAIANGLRQIAAEATIQLLKTMEPAEIIDQILIPTLEKVGTRFEKGEIFLPQLIQSAGAAQAGFEEIRKTMTRSSQSDANLSKGKIVLATVKGDIHDIGKNIVKVVLENSGYQIIDLGKDVPVEVVRQAVLRENAKLVGLSALMTTTVKNMAETIRDLKNHSECRIMVGGAVLTKDYALSIGADYFAKDAKAAMDIAKKVFEE